MIQYRRMEEKFCPPERGTEKKATLITADSFFGVFDELIEKLTVRSCFFELK